MDEIRTIKIDDEPDSIELLQLLLTKNFPQINVVGAFTSGPKALAEIKLLQPDLVFLDIEMPMLNGFELLKGLGDVEFHVLFVTAYNQFAIQAFKFNALDYLLKPVQMDELKAAVEKAPKNHFMDAAQPAMAAEQMKNGAITKIAIPAQSGVSFADLADIIYVEASNNYSFLHLVNDRKVTITKTLKDVQEVLESHHFMGVHRQFIINLNMAKHFDRAGNIITLTTGAKIPISRNHREQLMQQYGWL